MGVLAFMGREKVIWFTLFHRGLSWFQRRRAGGNAPPLMSSADRKKQVSCASS
jgi:hypothetical protein